MYLALLGLAAMGLLGTLFAGSSDGGEDSETPETESPLTPETPEDPETEQPEVVVTELQNGALRIEQVEGAPADLVTIVSETENAPGGQGSSREHEYHATVYMVSEGFDIDAALADFSAVAGDYDDFEQYLRVNGAEAVTSIDLGSVGYDNSSYPGSGAYDPDYWDDRTPVPDFETDLSNTFVFQNLNGSLAEFDPSEGMPYGLPVIGTDGDDLIEVTPTPSTDGWLGLFTDALDGNDTITLAPDASGRLGEVEGGNGDDLIHSLSAHHIDGEAGDDTIDVGPSGFVYGGEGDDVIRLDNSEDFEGDHDVFGEAGDDYLVGVLNASVSGGEGADTLTAVHGDTYEFGDGVYLTGGSGADTFQITTMDDSVGGTADNPERLASISDFDPLKDVLVLSSNLPGPITPTYADGTLLLELGDGSFASVYLGVENFDVSTITYADIEGEVDTAFATTQAPDLGATLVQNEDGTVSIELGEDDNGSIQVFWVSEEGDTHVGHPGSSGESEHSVMVFYVPEGVEIPDRFYDLPEDELELIREHGISGLASVFDLTLLDSWYMGTTGSNDEGFFDDGLMPREWNNLTAPPQFISDEPLTYHHYFDGSSGIQTIPDEATYLRNFPVYGSEEGDEIISDSTHIDAEGGDDTIVADGAGYILGGDGNDLITAEETGAIGGGFGNDTIIAEDAFGVWGGQGDDAIHLTAAGVNNDGHANGEGGDDYIVVVGNEDAHGDSGNDTVTAVHRAGEGVPLLEGGSGFDTFQVAAPDLTTGGTADAPVELARLADFDPAEDVLVLSSNLPGPVTPTYSDGTLLLELGDGSFASVDLGVDSFDASTIVFSDVEAGVEAAFAS
ncbi:hypothetical protein J7443_00090 [Tropicibacter sp. R15_0]|uniref:hypothetical protein n=1 Tax=Tropicibacter sp. R15_0 TaxID=2821101 RepID=UPI001ADAAF37|nr:hypothetical protein [Tropicibacter sp. R15_0]MBO9463615.1 hypothetical protein [Tropicibacter sp. R15_0]